MNHVQGRRIGTPQPIGSSYILTIGRNNVVWIRKMRGEYIDRLSLVTTDWARALQPGNNMYRRDHLEFQPHNRMNYARELLDRLLAFDAAASVVFGVLSILAPHGVMARIGGGFYNHDVHEILRLYGCLRVASGWILWHVRSVDDGKFRRTVCEALCICYFLQALAVARGQFTDRHTWLNWITITIMVTMAVAYGSFRFGKGGNLIKVYELPSSNSLA